MKKTIIILAIVSFALYACGSVDTNLPKGKNCQVLMDSVLFGQVRVGERVTKTAAVQCMQLDTLSVVIADSTGSYSIQDNQTTVKTTSLAGTAHVDVTFAPRSFNRITGVVQFNDSDGNTYDILLIGTGSLITSESNEIAPEGEETVK